MSTTSLDLGPTMWAVPDLEATRDYLVDTLGGTASEAHVVQHGIFLRCFVCFGDGREVQLMQPLPGEQTLTRFLDEHGEGLYGQVFMSTDLEADRERLREAGLRVVADEIDLGDMRECVLHPRSTHGVLTVLRQLAD